MLFVLIATGLEHIGEISMGLVITFFFLGTLTVTSYRSVPLQTDSSPFYTSTGERVSSSGVAISQDLLCGACRKLHKRCRHPEYQKKIHYGDVLYTEIAGFRIVNDCMGKTSKRRIKTKDGSRVVFSKQNNWIDLWVPRLKDEREFHKTYGVNKHDVYILKRKP
jgi:hypothetical protein